MVKRQPLQREIRAEDLAGLSFAMYIRDSTRDQAEGYGPDMQRSANLTFAARYGLIDTGRVYEEYVSGGSIRGRDQLLQAVRDLKAGSYRVLLAGWTHRFARSVEDAERIKREISGAGGVLVYTAQGIISGQKATRISERVLHVLDEEYRDNLSDLVAAGLRAKFEDNGTNGYPPLGTKHIYVRRDGSIAEGPERHTRAMRVLNEAELPALRDLFRLYIELGSYRKVADRLNALGYRPRRAALFQMSSVKEIVCNPFYGPEEIVRYHGGQVDEIRRPTPMANQLFPDDIHRLWQRAQERREGRAGRCAPMFTRVYPLHGVLRCVDCGSIYHGQPRSDNTRLSVHVQRETGCPGPRTVRSSLTEEHLVEVLERVRIPRDWRRQIQHLLRHPENDDGGTERKRISTAMERLKQQHLWGALTDEEFRRDFVALKARLEGLPKPTSSVTEDYRQPLEMLRSVGRIVGHPAIRQKPEGMALFKRFCDLAFERIEVRGSVIEKVHPRPRYRELFAIALSRGCEHVRSRGLDCSPYNLSLLPTAHGPVEIVGLEPILARLGEVS